MTEHKTFPGKVYTVSCAEDTTVVLPDPLGVKEAVVLECTAGQQLHVTATAGRLETSSDQAIVTELFKLAPRLRLTLLQGGAGGWLPKGFTELEYLESSGTQYIDTGLILENPCRLELSAASYSTNQTNIFVCGATDTASAFTPFYFTIYNETAVYRNVAFFRIGDLSDLYLNANFDTSKFHSYSLDNEHFAIDGEAVFDTKTAVFTKCAYSSFLFSRNGQTINTFVGAIAGAVFYKKGKIVGHFVPVLNADGEPGMWDKVSKQFFGNAGTGTFGYALKGQGESSTYSLRNPGVVPPSGVYARKSGENELELLADTEETTGEGWEWFANTAEAYEHFGIVPEGEEFLTE